MVVRSFGHEIRQAQRSSVWKIMSGYQPHLRSLRENSMSWWIGKYSSPSLATTATRCQHVERRVKPATRFQKTRSPGAFHFTSVRVRNLISAVGGPRLSSAALLLALSACTNYHTRDVSIPQGYDAAIGGRPGSILPPGRNWTLVWADEFDNGYDHNIGVHPQWVLTQSVSAGGMTRSL